MSLGTGAPILPGATKRSSAVSNVETLKVEDFADASPAAFGPAFTLGMPTNGGPGGLGGIAMETTIGAGCALGTSGALGYPSTPSSACGSTGG